MLDMFNAKTGLVVATIICVGLAGCGKKNKGQYSARAMHDQQYSRVADNDGFQSATTAGINTGTSFEGDETVIASSQSDRNTRIFRFGFDSFSVSSADYPALQAHSEFLVANPDKSIRIEGHTDERGSREYNIALGERRAKSVTNFLVSNGVNPSQIKVVSYGEEKPVRSGHDESSYKENRRAEVVYE